MDELQADRFIKPKYEPADDSSRRLLSLFVEQLFPEELRRSSHEKMLFVLSDVLAAAQHSESGLLAWQMKEEHFYDAPYGRSLATKVRDRLLDRGWLEIAQKGQRGICQLYRMTGKIDCMDMSLRKYRSSNVVEIRGPAIYSPTGNKRKGKKLRLKSFLPDVQSEIEKMERVNQMMADNPLEAPDGTVFSSCFRGFNEGRLDQGGRIYGKWQNKKPADRLEMTINEGPVVEVDIKGSFLFLANQLSEGDIKLPDDPYQAVPFVQKARDAAEVKRYRNLAKVIVGAAWYKVGRISRLPKGKKKDGFGIRMSLREQFEIPKDLRTETILNDIYDTFPFLEDKEVSGFDLMYHESEIILNAMLDLIDQGIPTYPVHDCLLCRKVDLDEVIKSLQDQMTNKLGSSAVLEVEGKDSSGMMFALKA